MSQKLITGAIFLDRQTLKTLKRNNIAKGTNALKTELAVTGQQFKIFQMCRSW